MKSHLFSLLFAASLLNVPAVDAAEQKWGGYIFTDTVDAAWTQDELNALTEELTLLPQAIQDLPGRPDLGPIQIFKSTRAEAASHHSAPPQLFWQLSLTVDRMPRQPRAEYLVRLRREFVHQLLHVHDSTYNLSESKAWRKQSGWRPREYLGIKIPGLPREADNQDPRGYASPAGRSDAEEDFATFGSVYFVTPDSNVEDSVACRTPGKFAFFLRAFPDYRPYLDQPHIRCRPVDDGFLDDIQFFDPLTQAPLAMGKINAETVAGFELLYATPGVADAAEVAGHLILRMKLKNNPLADALGIENPNDLVLSFLADTEADRKPTPPRPGQNPEQCEKPLLDFGQGGDLKDFDALRSVMQSLKGLSGGFLTTFDRQTLLQAVKTYTVDQDRTLRRFALVLTAEQKQRLIDQLYLAKKSYRSKYYFFDRNCASILVQLIGEGIGDEQIADFDPLVVPPNTLVALLIRKGLARETHPAFYSYKKKGQFAQDEIRRRITVLAKKFPDFSWPNPKAFSRHAEGTRTDAYEKLEAIAQQSLAQRPAIYQIGTLGQEAEMAFMDHTQHCEEVSTKPTRVIRRMQKSLLKLDPQVSDRAALDTNKLIDEQLAVDDDFAASLGSEHTKLSSLRLGVGMLKHDGDSDLAVATVGFALHRQDFGSTSRQSMQRATFVSLGEAQATYANAGLETWRVTGLALRKFKERLDEVPPFLTDAGTFGLGLTVLDLQGRRGKPTTGTVAGGELLANLWSSRFYDRFVYVSLGSALEATAGGHYQVALPLRTEALWTFDAARTWQLRGVYELRIRPLAGEILTSRQTNLSLAYRWANPAGTELLLRTSAEIQDEKSLYQLGIEWNRW